MTTSIVPQPAARKVIAPAYYYVGKRRKMDGYNAYVDSNFIGNFKSFTEAEAAADALLFDLARAA